MLLKQSFGKLTVCWHFELKSRQINDHLNTVAHLADLQGQKTTVEAKFSILNSEKTN